jgi:hypothetical protein
MPLLDHFQRPLHPLHPWESFHAAWADAIMGRLNELLPPRYFAAIQVHLGSRVEADVAEFEQAQDAGQPGNGAPGGVAVATWAPPAVTTVLPAVFPDSIEVQVFDTRDGAVLVAVVELVSPGNKDRPETRRAFAAKCAAYLQRGIGLVVADIVTNRQADLYADLVALLGQSEAAGLLAGAPLHAAAYRPVRRQESNQIDVWLRPLAVGQPLPLLPLALRGAGCVPLDLDATYTEARTRSRV